MLSSLPPISKFIEIIPSGIKHFKNFFIRIQFNPLNIIPEKNSFAMSRKQQKYCLVKACRNHFGTTENIKMFQ